MAEGLDGVRVRGGDGHVGVEVGHSLSVGGDEDIEEYACAVGSIVLGLRDAVVVEDEIGEVGSLVA